MVEGGKQLVVGIHQSTFGLAGHVGLNAFHLDVVNAEEIGLTRRVEVTDGNVNLLSGISRKVSGILCVGAGAVPFLHHCEIGGIGVARRGDGHAKMLRVRGNAGHVGIAGLEGDAGICGGGQAWRDDEIVRIECPGATHPRP